MLFSLICLPVGINVFMSACLAVCMCTCLPVYLSACLPVYVSTCLPADMSSCLHFSLSQCLPVYLSAFLYMSTWTHTSVCMSLLNTFSPCLLTFCIHVCLSTCLPVYLSKCLPFYNGLSALSEKTFHLRVSILPFRIKNVTVVSLLCDTCCTMYIYSYMLLTDTTQPRVYIMFDTKKKNLGEP